MTTSAAQPPASPAANTDDHARFAPVDWVLFVSISLIWGSSFLLIAIGLDDLTPGMVTWLRVASGALMLWIMRLATRGRTTTSGTATRIDPGDRLRVVALSVLWVAIPFTLFPLAQTSISSALTGLLNGATPIFVAIVSIIVTRRFPSPAVLAGLALGFAGVFAMSLPSLGQSSNEASGVAMVVAATVCYGMAINLAAPLQRRYGAITLMTPVLTLASLWLVPVGLRDLGENDWNADTLVAVLGLGLIGTGLAYWIMATLVGRVGPVRGSFITYLIPVVSLILGVALRDERVAALALVGAALTTTGAILASRRQR
ncbi:MAG: DMT family transporter [Actinomycetota bacterium]